MYQIKHLLKRGKDHQSCQDAIYSFENNSYIIAAVFDGCSEIEDSHFASNFLKKVFKNEFETINSVNDGNYDVIYSISELSVEVLNNFFKKLNLIRTELNLTINDFMSTCIFMFYDKNSEEGIIYAFGDGFIQIDKHRIIIDQENRPQYFTMFWKNLVNGKEILTRFLDNYEQIWSFKNMKNLIISSDGILSFHHKNNLKEEALTFLISDEEINGKNIINQDSFYEKKYNILKQNDWNHSDDLGIIRIKKNGE